MLVKLEWLGYCMVKKNYDDVLSRFHLIPERYRRTDEQTDRQTNRRTDFAISISRVSMLTRDKHVSVLSVLWCLAYSVVRFSRWVVDSFSESQSSTLCRKSISDAFKIKLCPPEGHNLRAAAAIDKLSLSGVKCPIL